MTSPAIRKAVRRRWSSLHDHSCPECHGTSECRDEECEVQEARVGGGYEGEARECEWCKRFPFIDLRAITREPDRHLTTIKLFRDHFRGKEWIVMGQARLIARDRSQGPSVWTFDAYLPVGVTDFEHDSAYAIRIPLIGVEFRSIYYGHTEIVAVIDPMNYDGFHVPPPGYNPMKLDDAHECKSDYCKDEPHIIVPEGNYVPPTNKELFKMVRGRFVEITFGVPPERTDHDEKV